MKRLSKLLRALAAALAVGGGVKLAETVRVHNARVRVVHQRVKEFVEVGGEQVPAYRDDQGELVAGRRWVIDPVTQAEVPDPRDVVTLSDTTTTNVKTTAGIDYTFAQTYGTAAAGAGLNYIALSNDALTETSASTTLSSEIAANGLTRAQATYAHTNGTLTATLAKTFTASGTQSARKGALFNASSSGTMHHALAFDHVRDLYNTDTLAVTFTLTLT